MNTAPFPVNGRPALLMAGRVLSQVESKTAACILMYRPEDVVAVVASDQGGERAGDVLGYGGDIPLFADIASALALRPEVAVVGTAPMGGALDPSLRGQLEACLRAGVDVVSGMHEQLGDDPDLRRIAREAGARIWDVRHVPEERVVSTGRGCTTGAKVVLVAGSDCNVGKMTTAVELDRAAGARGARSAWAATGQTGIMLRGRGIAVDRVISDFVGGAAEALVNFEGRDADVVFVEGQGSIVHPGYAGVTLGLMYGAMPDAIVMAHTADREHFKRLEFPIPPLADLIDLHERLMRPFKRTRVAAVTVNTRSLDDASARAFLREVERDTGRPATDVVRFGCDPVMDALAPHLPKGER